MKISDELKKDNKIVVYLTGVLAVSVIIEIMIKTLELKHKGAFPLYIALLLLISLVVFSCCYFYLISKEYKK